MQSSRRSPSLMNANGWMYFAFILIISFFTYFYNYGFPNQVFWDEPYHIAAAQKYLNRTYFMEQHPPLGKLLIALGEKITRSNPKNDQFIDTDYAKGFDNAFSFTGYRLFPSLLAWLTTPLLFFIFLRLSGNSAIASLLSFLYVFDNAMIVHSRGAMVDSPLTFFGVAMILLMLKLLEKRKAPPLVFYSYAALFGAAFGLALATKLVGLILVLFFAVVIYGISDYKKGTLFCAAAGTCALWFVSVFWYGSFSPFGLFGTASAMQGAVSGILALLVPLAVGVCAYLLGDAIVRRMIVFTVTSLGAFLLVFCAVWQIHFALGTTIQPKLSNDGKYQASDQYLSLLSAGKTASLSSFPVMMRDSLKYVTYYNQGVPRLDLCKPDENGSPFFFWPLGARSINYRWAEAGKDTYRYLYLQANPVVWLCGLLGVLLSGAMLFASVVFPLKEKLKHRFLMCTFFGMYTAYMLAISQLGRVMYLYHYFLPLIFSFILFALVVVNINHFMGRVMSESAKILGLTVLGVLIFVSYQVYRPLSYYEPISNAALQRRAIFPLWELNCVNCERKSLIVVPVSKDGG